MIEKGYSDEMLVKVLQQDVGEKQKAMNELFGRYSNKMLEFFYYSFNRDREKAKDFNLLSTKNKKVSISSLIELVETFK